MLYPSDAGQDMKSRGFGEHTVVLVSKNSLAICSALMQIVQRCNDFASFPAIQRIGREATQSESCECWLLRSD